MPAETPENAGYMIAAYLVAPVILVGYLASLWRRVRRTIGRVGGQAGRRWDGQTVGRSDGPAGGSADGRTVAGDR